MRSTTLLLVLTVVVLGSCTSAYKTGQTPDDIYYSPERQHDEYLTVKNNNDDRQYQNEDEYYDDRYLRMKVHNRMMWSNLDDYSFYNPRYSYGYYNSLGWNSPWSPYTYWNYYYNPYCTPVYIPSKTNFAYNHPRMFNLNSYTGQGSNNNPSKRGMYNNSYNNGSYNNNKPVRMVGVGNSNNNSSNSNTGNFLRNIFNGSSSNNNNSSNNNSSYSPSTRSSGSSSGSSNSSSSSSSAPVRRF